MATRRTTNPFTSANLGSGARTTTGGSYRNPRLGIQDYTAFGKGFASGFIMPKLDKKEEERLMDPIKLEDIKCQKCDDFYLLRDSLKGLFLAASPASNANFSL